MVSDNFEIVFDADGRSQAANMQAHPHVALVFGFDRSDGIRSKALLMSQQTLNSNNFTRDITSRRSGGVNVAAPVT